jgi:hypothetical protein
VPDIGMIEFRKNSLNLIGKDIDKYVNIEHMKITVNTERLPDLNRSAVIVFYNVTLKDPIIVKDGVYCPECMLISYVNTTFSFYVPHFTTYSLFAWASYSGYCGDGLCSLYESCYECSIDCGECKEGAESPGFCEELWICSAWSECNELNLRTRKCVDLTLCGTQSKKPFEIIECGKEQDYSSLVFFGVIVMLLVIAYLGAETYKKRKEGRKMDTFELERFIKGYVYRGYTAADIEKMLKSKGYTEKEIKAALKEVEKSIF